MMLKTNTSQPKLAPIMGWACGSFGYPNQWGILALSLKEPPENECIEALKLSILV
jgi:hypothetical protein